MTRIPHDSPSLENWLNQAKDAETKLAPSPKELESLALRLSSGSSSAAVAGLPLAKVTVGIGTVILAGGAAWFTLPRSESPSKSDATELALQDRAPAPAPLSGTTQEAAPEILARESLERGGGEAPVSEATHSNQEAEVRAPSPPKVMRTATASPRPTWSDVNDALTQGNVKKARGALESFIVHEDGAAKERAELALAQLELGGPRADRARAILRRLASSGREPSIVARAQSLLKEPH
jgi:hypothetical protein